ncbi:uncharacterized protein LOC126903055 isoform X2 [Daktulosphaira vitifoliae]|uniref:uncharacterized protein LOC126903055 isoform X2 n=1 Tax=Daktulosphaira vitifoliae TaxID=58002 RepID=UPI0021AA3799|nr:uncharacterized protein LOC126903055 isoform X2 [Daktulosphaira vitifoliae]
MTTDCHINSWTADIERDTGKHQPRAKGGAVSSVFAKTLVIARDRICKSEARSEIYNASMNDSNNINIGYYEDMKIVEHNLKDLKDEHNENDEDTKNLFQYELIYEPLYMIDYLLYNV